MIEIEGNIWNIKSDWKCITTNGRVSYDGTAVMGRGVALQAKQRYPELPRILGKHIKEFGNVPGLLSYTGQFSIWSFPVKHHWKEKADLNLIMRSVDLISQAADKFRCNDIIIPRPGCGNGQLTWEQVKPIVEQLDDRFRIINFK